MLFAVLFVSCCQLVLVVSSDAERVVESRLCLVTLRLVSYYRGCVGK